MSLGDYVGPAITVVGSALGASIGAYLSARFGSKQREAADEARFRRDSADQIIERLLALRAMLRDAEVERDVERWRETLESTYDAVDDARHRLPAGLRHAKRSLHAAIGEATGLALIDLRSRALGEQEELAAFDYRWTSYAVEYVDLVLDSLRLWRDRAPRAAEKVRAPDFDHWLAATGRYSPGESAGLSR